MYVNSTLSRHRCWRTVVFTLSKYQWHIWHICIMASLNYYTVQQSSHNKKKLILRFSKLASEMRQYLLKYKIFNFWGSDFGCLKHLSYKHDRKILFTFEIRGKLFRERGDKLILKIRRKIFRFWRITSKHEEITFLLTTESLEKFWFGLITRKKNLFRRIAYLYAVEKCKKFLNLMYKVY